MSTTDAERTSAPAAATVDVDVDAPRPPAARTRTDTVRDAIQVGACVLAGVLITVGFLLDPAGDADSAAEIVAAAGDDPGRFYWANTVSAFGLAMVAAVGLAVMRLVRGRGRVLATIGGLLTMIGGTAAAAGIFMYGAVLSGMVESGVETDALVDLQDHLGDSMRPGLAFLLGFVPLLLGLLLSAVALLMSRAAHRAVPVLLIVGVVSVMALGDTWIATLGDVVLTLGLVGVGLTLWQATAGRRT